MSCAASDEETEELVAALSDEDERRGGADKRGEEKLLRREHESDCDDQDDDRDDDDEDLRVESIAGSPRRLSEETEDDDDDDELHIAARAGIRLLEENMHFREEVLRLREQLAHVADEKAAVEQSLAARDAQHAAVSNHLREAILENQSVLSELSQAKDLQRATQQQITLLEQQLQQFQQQQQQRSPRRRSGQRLSPRRSASSFGRPLAFDDIDATSTRSGEATPPLSPLAASSLRFQSPTATSGADAEAACISPSKLRGTTGDVEDADAETAALERQLSYGELASSPRRRPTLARLREIEAKYDEEHQRCSSLKLELNFAQRRVSELKPLQSQLEQASHELEAEQRQVAALEAQLAQSQKERHEERELIQSLRQTVHAYEQLNDPRQRGTSGEVAPLSALQEGGATTAETVDDESGSTVLQQQQQLEQLGRAAEMIDGRFNLRDENEKLLQQLNSLTETVLALTTCVVVEKDVEGETEAAASRVQRRASLTQQRYLEQQCAVLQQLLRRFRLEWQHAHDARVCLEHEKAELLGQIERQRAKLQRTRSASVTSTGTSSRRASVETPQQQPPAAVEDSDNNDKKAADPISGFTVPAPEQPNDEEGVGDCEENDDDSEETHAQRLWARANAICEALLRPTSPETTHSREDQIENELLCFALLRRLVDSWTTDKPKRMQLHDWLTNAIRGTGVRKPLYLHELSSEIAVGFQTLMVPVLREKLGVHVHVEKRLRNVIVTDLRIQVQPEDAAPPANPASVQRVYHSLLSVIDGENSAQGGDEYQDWLGNISVRRASRGYLGKT